MQHWHRENLTIFITPNVADLTWERVVGETTSLHSIRTLIPGGWLNDEIMNIFMYKAWDENRMFGDFWVFDALFIAKLRWSEQEKKLKGYPIKKRLLPK